MADKLVSDYPINENAFALRDLLARTLETTVAVFESYGVPLPSRQYWCIGAPAERSGCVAQLLLCTVST